MFIYFILFYYIFSYALVLLIISLDLSQVVH